MGDFAASDVTVTSLPTDRNRLTTKLKMNIVTIAFGNASLTIPTGGGIPMPSIGVFGMLKFIRGLIVIAGNGLYEFAYDRTANKLYVYHGDYSASVDGPHVNAGGVAIAAQSIEAIVIGS